MKRGKDWQKERKEGEGNDEDGDGDSINGGEQNLNTYVGC